MADEKGQGQPRKTTVYLLDDHEIVRRGIRQLLEAEPDLEVIGESALAQEAERRIPALRPDVAVLDGRLPDGSGIEVCRAIRWVDPSIRVLILTSYDDDEALFGAIMAGASGYLLKQVAGDDLVETVRRVADLDQPVRATVGVAVGVGQAIGPRGNPVDRLVHRPLGDDPHEHQAQPELSAQVACDLSCSLGGRRLVDAADDRTNHQVSSCGFL